MRQPSLPSKSCPMSRPASEAAGPHLLVARRVRVVVVDAEQERVGRLPGEPQRTDALDGRMAHDAPAGFRAKCTVRAAKRPSEGAWRTQVSWILSAPCVALASEDFNGRQQIDARSVAAQRPRSAAPRRPRRPHPHHGEPRRQANRGRPGKQRRARGLLVQRPWPRRSHHRHLETGCGRCAHRVLGEGQRLHEGPGCRDVSHLGRQSHLAQSCGARGAATHWQSVLHARERAAGIRRGAGASVAEGAGPQTRAAAGRRSAHRGGRVGHGAGGRRRHR